MSWFGWFQRKDRRDRSSENVFRRAAIDDLRLQRDITTRTEVENQLSTTEVRAQRLDPRIRRVEVLAEVLYRQHVAVRN